MDEKHGLITQNKRKIKRKIHKRTRKEEKKITKSVPTCITVFRTSQKDCSSKRKLK